MYEYIAHYSDMATGQATTKQISFDGQFIGSEKDCYLYAMRLAYDLKESSELLESLEFIAC